MLETIARRSRMRCTPTGKRLVLGERDFEIFRMLYQFSMLRSVDLIALIKPRSEKRFIERLGHLYHDGGYIDRPHQQWEHGKALQQPVTYSLKPEGRAAFEEHGPLPHRLILSHRRQPGHRIPQFRHALGTSVALARMAVEVADASDQRIVSIEEIKARLKDREGGTTSILSIPVTIPHSKFNPSGAFQTSIVPDALYGIAYGDNGSAGYRFFAVENERKSPLRRSGMKLSSTLKKLVTYQISLRSCSYRTALGIPNLFPHVVARDVDHRAQIEELATDVLTPDEINLFRFTVND